MLRIGVSILGLLLFTAPVFAVDESWTSCQVDADCVVVGSICPNFYWAINRAYVFENAARNATERGNLDCAPSIQARPKRATCMQGQCSVPQNKPLGVDTQTAH
ncbi:MAG: hypothetical protein KBA75_03905 [Alphaproteobacteria bacterium]|nr:hypothetical protein [Alphaproteobacteria bacterium]